MGMTSTRHPWTATHRDYLLHHYHEWTAREIGEHLGRTARAVYQQAGLLGIASQHRAKIDAVFLAAVRRLNGRGWSDPMIAAELNCERHTVSQHRRAMGLPSARTIAGRYKNQIAARTR